MVTCKSCGTEIPADSRFCPKCGKPVDGPEESQPGSCCGPQDMRDWRDMKREWRGTRRGWGGVDWGAGTWWSEDWMKWWSWAWSPLWIMLNAVFFGLFIVGLGVLLFLAAWGGTTLVTWDNFWAYLLIFIGVLSILRGLARYLTSGRRFRPHGLGTGIVLITIGLAWLVAMSTAWSQYLWAFVIVAGGVAVIILGVINYLWMKTASK